MIAKTTLIKLQDDKNNSAWLNNLLHKLEKTTVDHEPLTILEILHQTCLDDAIHCLRCSDAPKESISLFGLDCAKQVLHLVDDERSIRALEVAERFIKGDASSEELETANNAAWAAHIDHRESDSGSSITCIAWATKPSKSMCEASEFAAYAAADAQDAAWVWGLRQFDHNKLDSALSSARRKINKLKEAQESKFKEMFCH